jgi:hypothetical protein
MRAALPFASEKLNRTSRSIFRSTDGAIQCRRNDHTIVSRRACLGMCVRYRDTEELVCVAAAGWAAYHALAVHGSGVCRSTPGSLEVLSKSMPDAL